MSRQKQQPQYISDSPFFRVNEAAAYLHVAPWSIGQAIREGKLAHSIIGKRYVIHRSDLDAFAASTRVEAA